MDFGSVREARTRITSRAEALTLQVGPPVCNELFVSFAALSMLFKRFHTNAIVSTGGCRGSLHGTVPRS